LFRGEEESLWTAYVVPGYSTGDLVAASVLSFGVGMAVGAMLD